MDLQTQPFVKQFTFRSPHHVSIHGTTPNAAAIDSVAVEHSICRLLDELHDAGIRSFTISTEAA
jgi:hypothetical protein